jgi:outer membrane protein assembly factor BamB
MSAIAVFTSSTLLSADWLAFRGQDGSGKSPDTGLLKKWSPQGPTLLWSVDFVGMGYAGVTISGDRIYTSGNVGERSMVFCLDKDGKKIWEAENGPAHADTRRYHGTRGAPTIDGDFVYDVTPLGEVAYFNAKTGEKIWNKNLAKNYDAPIPRWLFGHSVVVDGDHLICLVGGAKTLAVALNKRTGAMVWEAPPASNPASAAAAYTTPYFFEFDGIRIVAVMSEATVEGLDPKTGKRLFSIPWTNSRNVHCTMPIYQDGHLFLSTGYDGGTARLFKLTKNANGTIMPTEVWVESRFNNHHGGVVMVGDHVYGTSHDGQWCSINFMTGEIGYRSRGAGKGAAHYADGLIYGLTEDDKTVLLIKPDPKEFILLSSFELPNDAEGKSWAHPVVLNGRLYLRHAQYLYCYDVLSE